MIGKYHNHKPQTTPWHREEEPLNHHETPGRQIKQSNQLSLPHQDDCNTRMDIKLRTTKHRTITDSHNESNNKQKVNNKRTTALEWTVAEATGGLKCILLVPNLCPRFCCCWSTRNVQLAWRPSNECNVSSWRNTLIKLTHHDETKKRAHDSQIVKAKENLKLSYGGSSYI